MTDLVVDVDKPAHGGSCVGRVDGRVVFVGYSLPGERVRAALVDGDQKSRFWRADGLEVLGDPSPGRVPSPCPWFGPGLCGGCSWLHVDPAVQVELKADVLAETLARLGGIEQKIAVRSLGRETGWRTRVTLHVDDRGTAGFHRVRSRDVVGVADCRQADPRLDLPGLLGDSWPPGATIHTSVSDAGRAVLVRTGDDVVATGPAEHSHLVLGREFRCAVDGFWQSHRDAAEVLVSQVVELSGAGTGDRILDLFAGVGLFGLLLLDRCSPAAVTIVEGNRTAAGFARRNGGQDPRVDVLARDVRKWARRPRPADVVVLDPPRAGAGREVVAGIAATRARTVIYVSCEPSTLARDLKFFAATGYVPDHIEGFDVFPGTAHVETVVRLRRH
ncbi:MAG: methyltransferase [Candidatus Nanopelagicales bacterium]